MPCFHVPRVPMETHAEKEGRRGADPGFERAKKQGGAALGRVRGRVSRRTTIRGVGGRIQVRRRRRRGAPSRANVPRNAKSKCRCEPSCQPASLQVDALAALLFAFPSSIFIFLVTRRAPRVLLLSDVSSIARRPPLRDSRRSKELQRPRAIDRTGRFTDRSILADTKRRGGSRNKCYVYPSWKVSFSLVDRVIDPAPFVATCFRQRASDDFSYSFNTRCYRRRNLDDEIELRPPRYRYVTLDVKVELEHGPRHNQIIRQECL